jgi:hypothetical protein
VILGIWLHVSRHGKILEWLGFRFDKPKLVELSSTRAHRSSFERAIPCAVLSSAQINLPVPCGHGNRYENIPIVTGD